MITIINNMIIPKIPFGVKPKIGTIIINANINEIIILDKFGLYLGLLIDITKFSIILYY